MTRRRILHILGLRVGAAQPLRDELHERWLAPTDDELESDAIWTDYERARDAYVAALEVYFRASFACESGDLEALLAIETDATSPVQVSP